MGVAFQGFYERDRGTGKITGFPPIVNARTDPKTKRCPLHSKNCPDFYLNKFRSRISEAASPKRCCSLVALLTARPRRLRRGLARLNFPSQRAVQPGFLGSHLCHDRLVSIQAMDNQRPSFIQAGRQRSGQQACDREERTACRRWPHANGIGYEAWPQRQSGLQRAPRDIDACYNGLPHKAKCQNKQRSQSRVEGPRRQQSEASPCRRSSRSQADGKSSQVRTVKNKPNAQENQRPNDSRQPRQDVSPFVHRSERSG